MKTSTRFEMVLLDSLGDMITVDYFHNKTSVKSLEEQAERELANDSRVKAVVVYLTRHFSFDDRVDETKYNTVLKKGDSLALAAW